jgi:hypothetical protein
MPKRFFEVLSKIPHREIGDPVSIRYAGQTVDIDYALSADECLFLEANKVTPATVIEVGAGFGRTAHAILSNFDSVSQYHIVDLPEVLQLSRLFLSEALNPDQYAKLRFHDAFGNWKELGESDFDLFINIDSFQEMDREIVFEYEKFLMAKSKLQYLKQPIGKYRPEEFEIPASKKRSDVLDLGLSTEVFTLCDEDAYREQLARHLKNYSFSGKYELIAHSRCSFFHFYEHALFKRA